MISYKEEIDIMFAQLLKMKETKEWKRATEQQERRRKREQYHHIYPYWMEILMWLWYAIIVLGILISLFYNIYRTE